MFLVLHFLSIPLISLGMFRKQYHHDQNYIKKQLHPNKEDAKVILKNNFFLDLNAISHVWIH